MGTTPRRFKPSELRYDENGVPLLGEWEITEVALELLEALCPQRLRVSGPTPVLDIIEKLKASTGLSFRYEDLGDHQGKKILGKVNFPSKTLSLDPLLQSELEVAFRFTAAHEIGHWVLHRYNWQNWRFATQPESLVDDNESLCRVNQRGPREWLEHQANVFAAELVMPSATFDQALEFVQRKLGINRNLGSVLVTAGSYSLRDYQATVSGLAREYDTSMAAVKVRLQTLGLVVHREKVRAPRDVLPGSIDALIRACKQENTDGTP